VASREADRTCLYCFSEAGGLGRSITNMHYPPERAVTISIKISCTLTLQTLLLVFRVFFIKLAPLDNRTRVLFLFVPSLPKSNSSAKYLLH